MRLSHLLNRHCMRYLRFAKRHLLSLRDKSMPLVRELAAEGAIDGIEVDHPSNSPEDRAECVQLCREYGLVPTAGTDFHGRNHKVPHPIGPRRRGFAGCGVT